jgi:hypothetical protein
VTKLISLLVLLTMSFFAGFNIKSRVNYLDVISQRVIEINGYHYRCEAIYAREQETKNNITGFIE